MAIAVVAKMITALSAGITEARNRARRRAPDLRQRVHVRARFFGKDARFDIAILSRTTFPMSVTGLVRRRWQKNARRSKMLEIGCIIGTRADARLFIVDSQTFLTTNRRMNSE